MPGPAICETIHFTTRTEERLLISLPSWAGGQPAGQRPVTKLSQHPKATHAALSRHGRKPIIPKLVWIWHFLTASSILVPWDRTRWRGLEGKGFSQLSILNYLAVREVGDDKYRGEEAPFAPPTGLSQQLLLALLPPFPPPWLRVPLASPLRLTHTARPAAKPAARQGSSPAGPARRRPDWPAPSRPRPPRGSGRWSAPSRTFSPPPPPSQQPPGRVGVGEPGAAATSAHGAAFYRESCSRPHNSITVSLNLLFKMVLRFSAFSILLCHSKSIRKTLTRTIEINRLFQYLTGLCDLPKRIYPGKAVPELRRARPGRLCGAPLWWPGTTRPPGWTPTAPTTPHRAS